MGVGLCLCFDPELEEVDFEDTDGKDLFACAEALDEVGRSVGAPHEFSSFIFDPEDVPDGVTPQVPYHDSQEGLQVITGLITALEAPDGKEQTEVERRGGNLTPLWRALGMKSDRDGKRIKCLLEDLRELERCLKIAVKEKARFFLLAC